MTNVIRTNIVWSIVGIVALSLSLFWSGVLSPLSTHADMASTTAAINISAITTVATDTAATIMWSTDQEASSQVGFGTSTTYGNFSGLDITNVTSHTVLLSGLIPGTLYHFQVMSQNASGTLATSSDQTFMTTGTTTPTTTPATAPTISNITSTPTTTSATIMWTTDATSTSQVQYGTTTAFGNWSDFDSNLVTNHSVVLSSLTPNTIYYFQVISGTGMATTSTTDYMFTTLMLPEPGTTTPTTTPPTDITTLQNEIADLQHRVALLEQAIAALLGGGGSGGGTSTPPAPATIDQNGGTFSAGGTIDFGGRNFGHEENVTVTQGSNTVTIVHADGGGNFSTGSLPLPTTPGTYHYIFSGQTSGTTVNATITVQ
jgi:hypothetical protein